MFRSRAASVLVALALLAALGPGASDAPAQAATGSGGCPNHLVPATRFTDTLGSIHRAGIDCAVWWDVVRGQSSSAFAPSRNVTRGQTAAMLARLLRTTGHAPSSAPSAGFTDTADSPFRDDIDLLASLDIIAGVTPTRFEPLRPTTRAQMASLIARTFERGYGQALPPGPMPFTDVSSTDVHRDAIGRLVAAGITAGTSRTTFDPLGRVIRAQMASFVTRATTVLLARDQATLPTARPGPGDAYASRTRAAWVHLFDGTLKTRDNIRAMVAQLAAADANVVYAQVIRRHDSYYDSSVLPRTVDTSVAPSFDVLAELLDAAHARGIEVHAWYSVAPTWHGEYGRWDPPPGWMHTDHGPRAPVADRWVTRSHGGTWSTYLDPGVPQVREHVASVVGELASSYPQLDGIHLDYVRYDGPDQGYNPIALATYRAETGASGTPAPTDATWSTWRRTQTRRIIERSKQAIEASGNAIELSAAVTSWGEGPPTADRAGFRRTPAFTRTFQDWDDWVRNGRLDAVLPMNYFRQDDRQHAVWFSRWIAYERALAGASRTQVIPGPAGYLNTASNTLVQTRAAMRLDGASIYSYQQPTIDSSRGIWSTLAGTRWGYAPAR